MLCENCNQNEATVHYKEVVNGVVSERNLCSYCAAKLEMSGYGGMLNSEFPFVKLLTGMFAGTTNSSETESPMQHVVCPKCGMTYEEFTEVGKFGCNECYSVFGPLIDDNMKKMQGSNVHRGKKYHQSEAMQTAAEQKGTNGMVQDAVLEKNKKIEELQRNLDEAVMLENFEAAAKYRDEIKALKKSQGGEVC